MRAFEMCPWCAGRGNALYEDLQSMVLSDDDKEMQCGVCSRSWKLRQSEALLELARQQRAQRLEV